MGDIAYRRATEQDIAALIALRAAFLANCSRIRLHAYPNAAAIYTGAGFVSGSDEMTLNLLSRNRR